MIRGLRIRDLWTSITMQEKEQTLAQKPNIVFIFPDQQRGDTVGFAGNSVVKTPNLDRLACESVVFNRCSSNAPICMPARKSLMCGLPVTQHGLWANNLPGDPELPNHVRNISNSGYRTAQIGKVHFNVRAKGDGHSRDFAHLMHDWGWEDSIELRDITAYTNAECYYTDFLEERGHLQILRDYMRTYVGGEAAGLIRPWETPPSLLPNDEDLDIYTAMRSVEYIENYDDDRPFYLSVLFPGPHNPFDSPSDDRALYNPDDMPGAILEPETGPLSPQVERMKSVSNLDKMTASQAQMMRMYYYAKVTHVDHGIGMVLDALQAKGVMDNTWIIYTSDHGEMLGDHRCSHKALFYESAMNIPLCIRPPGGTKAWQSKALTDQLDLTDTMLEIADAPYLDNASEYRSSLVSKVLDGPDVANAQVGKETVFSDVRLYSMVRDDRYKLAVDSLTREPTELYDMDNDSDQIHNLVEDATLDDVRSELMDHLNTHLDKLDHDKVKKYQDTLNANPLLGSAAHRMGTPTVI